MEKPADNFRFIPPEIEKEKGVIIEEINMYEDTPRRRVGELLMKLMYGDQPAGWGVAGEKDIIRKITREDFRAYRDAHYVAGATLVVVAGKFDEEAFLSQIEKDFSTLSTTAKGSKLSVDDSQDAPRVHVQFKESDQTHVAIGLRSKPVSHPDSYALDVLADVLGGGMSSRLFERVREQMGAAYYVRAGNDSYTDHGIFEVAAGVDHTKLFDVISAIIDELKKLRDHEVPAHELQKAKDSLIGNLYLSLEKSDEIANFYGGQEVLKHVMKTPDEIAEKIAAVSAADVKRVAEEVVVTKNLNLALIGPFRDEAPFVKLLEFR